MPHLRDYGYEAGSGDDDATDRGARARFGMDREDGRCRDDACARDESCEAPTRPSGALHPHD